MTSNRSDCSRSDQDHISSIRFANSIIVNIGAPLRDGPPEDDHDDTKDMDTEGTEHPSLFRNDEELHIETSSFVMDIVVENATGPSGISAGPR